MNLFEREMGADADSQKRSDQGAAGLHRAPADSGYSVVTADDEADDDGQGDDGTPPRHHVTFGPAAVIVGFLVGLSVLALAFTLPWAGDVAPGVFGLALAYGGLLGAVTALPLGVVLGFLLRPVRNQWVHVGVFFGVFTLVALLIITLLSPSRVVLENLPIALIIGGAAALARASVWKLVRVR